MPQEKTVKITFNDLTIPKQNEIADILEKKLSDDKEIQKAIKEIKAEVKI